MLSAVLRVSPRSAKLTAAAMPISTDCRAGPFNWVNGRKVDPVDDIGTFDNVEPRTGKILAKVRSSGPKEVQRAVDAARQAFKHWSKVDRLALFLSV
jgi:hypothetical protein